MVRNDHFAFFCYPLRIPVDLVSGERNTISCEQKCGCSHPVGGHRRASPRCPVPRGGGREHQRGGRSAKWPAAHRDRWVPAPARAQSPRLATSRSFSGLRPHGAPAVASDRDRDRQLGLLARVFYQKKWLSVAHALKTPMNFLKL